MKNESSQITNKILEPELSYDVQGAAYNVSNKYGNGLKEHIYQKALAEELTSRGLIFEQQKRISIYSFDTGKVLGVYIPDFVVAEKIIIEIKAIPFTTRQAIDQQRSYLRASKYEIAYLINFGVSSGDVQRCIYTNDRRPFIALLHS